MNLSFFVLAVAAAAVLIVLVVLVVLVVRAVVWDIFCAIQKQEGVGEVNGENKKNTKIKKSGQKRKQK